MNLKMSANLRKIMDQSKELSLDKSNKYFRLPTDDDLENDDRQIIDVEKTSLEDIKKYVSQHTSGLRKHYDLAEGGMILVSFPKFVEMINDGYNIYKAEVLSDKFISIQYQKEIRRDGRGR